MLKIACDSTARRMRWDDQFQAPWALGHRSIVAMHQQQRRAAVATGMSSP